MQPNATSQPPLEVGQSIHLAIGGGAPLPYLVVATGQSQALSEANLAAWVLLAPAANARQAPWLLALADQEADLMPPAPVSIAVHVLQSYLTTIATPSQPLDAQWALSLLDSASGTDDTAVVRACHDIGYVFKLICFMAPIPPPNRQDFVSIGNDDSANRPTRWRIDWRNPSATSPGAFINGAHRLGATLANRRRIFIEKEGGIHSISSLDELVEVLELARQVTQTDIWQTPAEPRGVFAARVARLRLIRKLLHRYSSSVLVQINNNGLLAGFGFRAAEIVNTEIAYNDAFISPRPPASEAPPFPDETDFLSLTASQGRALDSALHECTGVKLRTCLDTGTELHLYYKTTAMSRRELLREFLSILRVLPTITGGKALYALSAFTAETAAGTLGEISGPAYSSELATAWAWGDYLRELAEGTDPRLVWDSVALTRWRYDGGTIDTKSLGLLDLPYIN